MRNRGVTAEGLAAETRLARAPGRSIVVVVVGIVAPVDVDVALHLLE
jgi:hypothetical protein